MLLRVLEFHVCAEHATAKLLSMGKENMDYAYPAIEDIGEDNDPFQGQMLSRELETLYFKGHRKDNRKGAVLTVAPLLLQMTL